MESNSEKNNGTAGRKMIVTKTLHAPRQLVWEVWTTPAHIKNWWGPNGFTNTISVMDVTPGGVWDFVMHGPNGTNYKNKAVYKEIIKTARIVFDHISPNFSATITFDADGNKTLLTWKMLFETVELYQQVVKAFKADDGLKQNVERLELYLQNVQV